MTDAEAAREIAHRTAQSAARDSYGRLLAFLAARARNIAACEDALADAFRAALETWPVRGVPDKPEAWLLTAARRNLSHLWRHDRVRDAAVPDLAVLAPDEAAENAEVETIPDEVLSCCSFARIRRSTRRRVRP